MPAERLPASSSWSAGFWRWPADLRFLFQILALESVVQFRYSEVDLGLPAKLPRRRLPRLYFGWSLEPPRVLIDFSRTGLVGLGQVGFGATADVFGHLGKLHPRISRTGASAARAMSDALSDAVGRYYPHSFFFSISSDRFSASLVCCLTSFLEIFSASVYCCATLNARRHLHVRPPFPQRRGGNRRHQAPVPGAAAYRIPVSSTKGMIWTPSWNLLAPWLRLTCHVHRASHARRQSA